MSDPKRILLMEDDPFQADWLMEEIHRVLPDVEFKYYSSESAFLKSLEQELRSWKPEYALLDLLTRYYSVEDFTADADLRPFDSLPKPDQAGIRSAKRLAEVVPQCNIRLMTVIDYDDACDWTVFQKGSENFHDLILEFIKS